MSTYVAFYQVEENDDVEHCVLFEFYALFGNQYLKLLNDYRYISHLFRFHLTERKEVLCGNG